MPVEPLVLQEGRMVVAVRWNVVPVPGVCRGLGLRFYTTSRRPYLREPVARIRRKVGRPL
jgi:hypothetical protein